MVFNSQTNREDMISFLSWVFQVAIRLHQWKSLLICSTSELNKYFTLLQQSFLNDHKWQGNWDCLDDEIHCL